MLEAAWAAAWPYGAAERPTVVLRHDNGIQFTSTHYRDVAAALGIRTSRTRYRHPDGNAFIERLYRSLKDEVVWPSDFATYEEALAAITAWITDYTAERPHQALGYRTRPRSAPRDQRNRRPELSTPEGVTTLSSRGYDSTDLRLFAPGLSTHGEP